MGERIVKTRWQQDWRQYPTVRQVMRETGLSREAVWARVRTGDYVAYRHRAERHWEWRLAAAAGAAPPSAQ